MGFATVKSDPYKAGLSRKRPRFRLWTEAMWKELCEIADYEAAGYALRKTKKRHPISADCLALIVEFNRRLYGGNDVREAACDRDR